MSQKNNQTIQQKMAQLDEYVAWFDSDDFALEAAFDRFKQAEVLAKDIENELDTMKNEINVLKKRFDVDSE